MSDDEAFLEFRIGESPPNAWAPSEDRDSLPVADSLVESPVTPAKNLNRRSPISSPDALLDGVVADGIKELKFNSEPKFDEHLGDLSGTKLGQGKLGPALLPQDFEYDTERKDKLKEELGKELGKDPDEELEEPALFEIVDRSRNEPDNKSERDSGAAEPCAKPISDGTSQSSVTENDSNGHHTESTSKDSENELEIPANADREEGTHAPSDESKAERGLSTPGASQSSSPRTVHFGTDTPPTVHTSREGNDKDHKGSHSRASSHAEYFQGPTGEIEKRLVYDESGLVADEEQGDDEDSWEPMATVGSYEVYDDKNNLLIEQITDEAGGEGRTANDALSGYTRVANNDDAASITSLDDKTDFLFDAHKPTDDVDADFQMAATKSMLTDQQKIAYAGLCRLGLAEIANQTRRYGPKATVAVESLQRWGTKFILRLYNHLGLSNEEQLMIESLAAHNVFAEDLTPCLKQIQKVTDDGTITKEIIPEIKEDPEDEQDNADGSDQAGPDQSSVTDANSADDEKKKLEPYDVGVEDLHEELPTSNEIDRSLEVDVKWTVMCDLFLILLADAEYDSRSRTLLTLVADKLGVTANEVSQFERKVTDVLQIDDNADQDWTEEDIIEKRRRKTLKKKYAYVGLATVGGGLVIGLSGGLLAPVVGAGLAGALGTIGIAGTGGFLAGVGGTAIIATASTAIGAHVGSRAMLRRVGHVRTFEFRPIFNNNRANLVITVSGWMTGKDDDVRLPFSTIDPLVGDVMSVLWEPEMMRSLGQTINIFATEALAFGVQQILAATVFSMLIASLQAPMWLAKLSYLVDNPWSVSLDRAWAAGLILADTLMKRKLGNRPATLVGYSLGARVIYSCITELARHNAFGLIQDVYLFGTPVFYNKKKFAQARAMVSGRFVNGYSRKDWILAFLFPAAKRYGSVLGLDAIPDLETEMLCVENIDVSEIVDGHMNYRAKMPLILKQCGWPVLSEEFEEIDDPDPEHTREKQLKLLNELKSTDKKPKKSGIFSYLGFDWMQLAKSKSVQKEDANNVGSVSGETLFDVDAIRNEMESLQPRMVFEQEPMPLPEVDEKNIPIELLDVEQELVSPSAALDYDDPSSPKPVIQNKFATKPQEQNDKADASKPQLQFDDFE